jgi:glutamate racemase
VPKSIAPDAPILFFDSGIGGISVLRPTLALLPQAPIVYATDYIGLPYGEKSEAEVGTRVSALLGRLIERFRPRVAVIACNTASTIALAHVRAALDTPFVGTVPAIKPAALSTETGVIGLLGTEATIRQPYVDRLEREFCEGKLLVRHAAPELVAAAEAKLRGEPVDPAVYVRAIKGLEDAHDKGFWIDRIVLGCTHFPLVRDELIEAAVKTIGFPPDIQTVDGGDGIARRIAHLTTGQNWPVAKPRRILINNGGIALLESVWPLFSDMGFGERQAI